jgi:carbon storage regulator
MAMLVLSRRIGERIRIGESVGVTILNVQGKRVRLGITAPAGTSIIREELRDKLESAGANGSSQSLSS